jgi:hypothetical protein
LTVTVSPTSASVVTTKTQQFTASVANASNPGVSWHVNGVAGGDAAHGTISSSGMYAAPATVPSPATVTVTAVSQRRFESAIQVLPSFQSRIALHQAHLQISLAPHYRRLKLICRGPLPSTVSV